jgi:hypothetical protein
MYCVIQKVTNKKPNQYGHYKELTVCSTTFGLIGEEPKTKYSYRYSNERFERPIKAAYKISIHESYRQDGKVKKKQWVICTMGYYDLNDSWPGDFLTSTELKKKLEQMEITEEKLWEMVYQKLDPLIKEIKKEFESTEEYKAKKEHEEILTKYRAAKDEFEKEYGSDTYDYCYDIFGTLQNEEYLNQLKAQQKAQQGYQERSYQNRSQSNDDYNYRSSYSTLKQSNYTDDEKGMLKKIYRTASKQFHPDITNDDGTMMKFLTKLKEQWGI